MEFRLILVLVFMCVNGLLAKKTRSKVSVRKADSLADIMNLLMDQKDASLQIEKRSSRFAIKDICTFPEDPKVVTVDYNKEVYPSQPFCQPSPIAMPINVPIHHVIYPNYVTLYRCLGGQFSRLQQCVASKKERIIVKYLELTTNTYEGAVMYNHTECTENCIFKPEDCNPRTETFKNCHCNCNINANHCNSTWQTFNSHKCDCDCKYVQKCDIDKEWNPVTCQCQCLKCLRDLCTKANLGINEETCYCNGQAVSRRSSSVRFSYKKSILFRNKNN
ncbi:uncharacterized protein LOC116299851 [Actinia tenebrosa]|uniref:Uncharacterized protein LOC116299851 n=1 Tax=Actinia tenebrosa TaxID=6105 RepID=A0A6P8I787_ACTTE|nr:uncharacterized protein LOC116299851 [Actinia tenebrosa]